MSWRQGLEIGAMGAGAVVGALLRGKKRRPAGRSLTGEMVCSSMRALVMRSQRRGIPWLRDAMALAPARGPMLDQVDTTAVDAGGVPAEWFVPRGAQPQRTLVYFHGGGYVVGSVDAYRDLLSRLAVAIPARVLGVDYRLAPEHPLPAAQEDCLAATRFALEQGAQPAALALAGDSAGGALSVATLCALRDAGDPLPAAAVLFCPWTDPMADDASFVANAPLDFGDRSLLVSWAEAAVRGGELTPADPRITLRNAALAGLPPLHVQGGECEVLHDQIVAFCEAARAGGVDVDERIYPGMFHIFQVQASMVPEGEAALADAVRFLDERLVN